jgi:integrase
LQQQFLQEMDDVGASINTILNYKQTFLHFNKTTLTLEHFNSARIQEQFASTFPPTWERSTAEKHLCRIARFGNWLAANHHTRQRHRAPNARRRPKRREVMTPEEINNFLSYLRQRSHTASAFNRAAFTRDYLVVKVLHETGCRISEALDLCVDDIISNEHGHFALIRGTKTEDAERSVSISTELFIELVKFSREQSIIRGRLFRTRTGKRVDRVSFGHWLTSQCTKLEIGCHVTPHLFRYMYIIRKISEGESALEVMTRLGHSGVEQTVYYFNQVRRLMPWVTTNEDVNILERRMNYWRNRNGRR